MNHPILIDRIKHYIQQAQEERITRESVYSAPGEDTFQHEFLFFIKPEITLRSETVDLDAILEMVFGRLGEFDLHVRDISILAASYLEKHNIIARHYGVINSLSRKSLDYLSNEAREKFGILFGKTPEQVEILGSIEFLERYPGFTPFTLDALWQNIKTEKLAGGTYCGVIPVKGKQIFLINGFHPRQLIHFTEKGRSIVAFTLAGNTDWGIARNSFIGTTNPADARAGSIRKELLDRREEFGLQVVSASQNGFHLSAGPVEGVSELIRYCSDYVTGQLKTPGDFTFGRQLLSAFGPEKTGLICSNAMVEFRAQKIRTFDLTEEKNSTEALRLLKESNI